MVKYDYEKFFSVVEFDFFDNPDLAMYVEDVHLDSVTPDSVIIKINFTLYGDITKDNFDEWQEEFTDDMEDKYLEVWNSLVNSTDRYSYTIKQKMKFYFNKEILDECIRRGYNGESGEVELRDIVRMIVTISYESKIQDDIILVDREYIDAFDDGVGFPIPEDVDALNGYLQFGV